MRLNPLHKDRDDVATDSEPTPAAGVPRHGADEAPARRHAVEPEQAYEAERPAAYDSEAAAGYEAAPAAEEVVTEKRRIAPRAPQFGSGLSGYLAAVGSYLVIVPIVHAVVARVGTGRHIALALDTARVNQPTGVSWSGAIALLVLAFVACLIGGYVCGTMARRSGLLEGLAVWLWAAVAAVVASLIVEFSSARYAVLYQFDLFPRIQVGSLSGTNGAIITAIILAAGGLLGALLGGGIGAAAHRQVRVLEAASWSR